MRKESKQEDYREEHYHRCEVYVTNFDIKNSKFETSNLCNFHSSRDRLKFKLTLDGGEPVTN